VIDWLDGFVIFIHPFMGWMIFSFEFIYMMDGFVHFYSLVGWMILSFFTDLIGWMV
jgi:hypothetical protein